MTMHCWYNSSGAGAMPSLPGVLKHGAWAEMHVEQSSSVHGASHDPSASLNNLVFILLGSAGCFNIFWSAAQQLLSCIPTQLDTLPAQQANDM